jgi:hypothetical protein
LCPEFFGNSIEGEPLMKAFIVALCIAAALAAGTARSPFANAAPAQVQLAATQGGQIL